MKTDSESKPTDTVPLFAAFALCGAGGVMCAAVVAGWRSGVAAAPEPFVWWDVVLAYVLGAVPAATQFAAGIRRRLPVPAVLAGALGVMLVAWQVPAFDAGEAIPRAVWRPLLALCWATAASLLVAAAVRRPLRPALRGDWRSAAPMVAVWIALAGPVPGVYATVRVRQHVSQLQQLLDEARFAECARRAHALSAFDPSLTLQGMPPSPEQEMPLSLLVVQLDEHVRELEGRVARPLPPDAPDVDRLVRAEELSMLGREPEAAVLVAPLAERQPSDPRAWGVLGVIEETREDFTAARAAFGRAAELWEGRPASEERTAGLTQAVRGIAYAERKLGRYRAAEAAYQRLLAISRTADTHFLLAKFYEDTQQASAASAHARRAMELAPETYSAAGQELIDSLAERHFGCLPVYMDERSRDTRR